MKTKSELLAADVEYRTIIALQHGNPDAPDHSPNDEEIAGSMIRAYGDRSIEEWLALPDTLREGYPQVEHLIREALDPKHYDL